MSSQLKSHKRLDIQGLRAVAVLAVLFYHLKWIPGGFVGVDIFFVVSGFVITSLIFREIQASNHFRILNFFARRARRLLPVLSLVIFLTLLASVFLESPSGAQQSTLKIALAGTIFVANIVIPRVEGNYFDAVLADNPLLHLWSLSVEEQFYILIPILILLILKITKKRNFQGYKSQLVLLCTTLFLFSIILLFAIYFTKTNIPIFPNSEASIFYSPFTRAWEFLLGSIVAVSPKFPAKKLNFLGNLGFVILIVSCFLNLTFDKSIVVYAPIACLATAMVISCGTSDYFSKRLLENKFFVWLGDRSYSIYLIHWPMIVFVSPLGFSLFTQILILFITFLLSHLAFTFVESKFRYKNSLGTFFESYKTFFAWGSLIPVMILSVIFYIGNQNGWNTNWALGGHSGIQRDCDVPPFKPLVCSWGDEKADSRVLVVGDSQAWSIADGVISAGLKSNKQVILASYNNCPFVGVIEFNAASHCEVWQRELVDWIEKNQPDYVVIANATYNGQLDEEAAAQIIQGIRSFGSKAIWIINPISAPESLVRKSLLIPLSNSDRIFARPLKNDENDLLKQKLKSIDGTFVVDPSDFLCENYQCYVSRRGVEFFTDQNHLSVVGAKLMTNQFVLIFSQ